MIQSYLDELRGLLSKKLTSSRVDEVVKEAESHLRESARESSEVQAVQEFGPARLVAEQMIRQEKGYSTAPAWRIAMLPLGLMVLQTVVLFLPGILGTSIHLMSLLKLVEYAFIGSVAWVVWRSRRWIVLPLAACLAVLFLVTPMLVAAFPETQTFGVSRSELVRGYQRQIENLTRDQQQAEGILRGTEKPLRKSDAGTIAQSPTMKSGFEWFGPSKLPMQHGVELPYAPFTVPLKEDHYLGTAGFDDEQKAKAAWTQYGTEYLASLKNQLVETERGLAFALNPRENANIAPSYWPMALAMFGWQVGVITLVNWLVLLMGSSRNRKMVAS